jgi:hypothetical protein
MKTLVLAAIIFLGTGQVTIAQNNDGAVTKKVNSTEADKAAKARINKEQEAQKKKMEQEEKKIKDKADKVKDKAISDADKVASDADKAVKSSDEITEERMKKADPSKKTGVVKRKAEIKRGTESKSASVARAKEKIIMSEEKIKGHQKALENGKNRIEAARVRLAKAKAEGKINEEEYAAKMDRINTAEAKLKKFSESLNDADMSVKSQMDNLNKMNTDSNKN